MVTIAKVAILKISNPKCTTYPKDHSCEVSLQSNLKIFNFHGYHGNNGHFENVEA
jgi:hypothetical protein